MLHLEVSSCEGERGDSFCKERSLSIATSASSVSVESGLLDVGTTFQHEATLDPMRVGFNDGGEEVKAVSRLMRGKEALKVPSPLSRLKPKELGELDALIESKGSVSEGELIAQCRVLVKADLSDTFFEQKDWLVFAFMGYQEGLLSSSQLAAAAHLDLFLHTYPDAKEHVVSLNDPDVRTRVFSTFDKLQGKSVTTAKFDHLSPIESLILRVPLSEEVIKSEIYKEFIDYGSVFIDRSGHEMLIPSPRALQEMLDTISPLHSVTVFPTFGYSTKIRDFIHIPHLRVLGIDCRYFPQPDKVHHCPKATPFDMTHHDGAFHAIMTSFDPYREIEDILGIFFWEQYEMDKESDEGKALKEVAIAYIDRAFFYSGSGVYLYEGMPLDDPQCFFHAMILTGTDMDTAKYVALMKECFIKNELKFPVTSLPLHFFALFGGDRKEQDLACRLMECFGVDATI